jgi:hypothetical protein
MLKNKTPKTLIELTPNNFSKVEYIWLVPTIINKTNLIGFAFKDETDLDSFINGLNNNSILIDFGEVDITIDENVYDKCNIAALIKFPNFEIVP